MVSKRAIPTAEMIPLEMNAFNAVKPRHLARPLQALERQVEQSYLSGNFMHPHTFSSLSVKLVFAFGVGKDEMATSMLER